MVLAGLLALSAMGAGSAWANGHHGNGGQHDRPQAPQSDRHLARTDDQLRSDRPARNNYPIRDYDPPARYESRNGDLQSSVRRVQRETGGQVLRAQPILRDGREMYRVKVLTPEGRIRVYEDDSSSQRPGHRDLPYRDPSPPPRRRYPG